MPGRPPLAKRLEALIRAEFDLGTQPLGPDTDLGADLLLDSLAKAELAMVIEDELSIGISDDDMAAVGSFADLCALVSERLASG